MARPLRFCIPGLSVHIYCRGNRKERIFFSERDYFVLLSKLQEALIKYDIACFAFCLMPNHYHLFLKMRQANLSAGIHYLNSSFSNWLKAKHKITGHVFQGRFGSVIVDDAAYALFLSAYIHLNPVRAKICAFPEEYRWSSYNDYFDFRRPLLPRLDRETILHFLHPEIAKALPLYKKYVHDQMKVTDLRKFITQGISLGEEDFIRRVKAAHNITGNRREHAAALRADDPPRPAETVTQILYSILSARADKEKQSAAGREGKNFTLSERDMLIYLEKKYCALTLAEIGRPWKLDYGAVAQIVLRMERRRSADPVVHKILLEAEKLLGGQVLTFNKSV
jgi:putative transposase